MEHDRLRARLAAFGDDELDQGSREEISAHLRHCTTCREEMAELTRIDSLLRSIPEIKASDLFSSQVLSKIAGTEADSVAFLSAIRRIVAKFLEMVDSIFELAPGYGQKRTASLDEFGDFPPFSLAYAYFQVIGHHR